MNTLKCVELCIVSLMERLQNILLHTCAYIHMCMSLYKVKSWLGTVCMVYAYIAFGGLLALGATHWASLLYWWHCSWGWDNPDIADIASNLMDQTMIEKVAHVQHIITVHALRKDPWHIQHVTCTISLYKAHLVLYVCVCSPPARKTGYSQFSGD